MDIIGHLFLVFSPKRRVAGGATRASPGPIYDKKGGGVWWTHHHHP
jgi:hypothetical protein